MPSGIYKRTKEMRTGKRFHYESSKIKMSTSHTGVKLSKSHRENISKSQIGNKYSFGLIRPEETREKFRNRMLGKTGELSPAWKGGLAKILYPIEFNKELKLRIRERDGFVCQLCEITEKECIVKYGRVLSVNHIDYDKNNCSDDNLNALCVSCNGVVNGEREKWTLLFKKKLIIKSL